MALSSKTLEALVALHKGNDITMEQLCDFLSDRCRQLETELEERRAPLLDNKALIFDELREMRGKVTVRLDMVHCYECRHKDTALCRCRRSTKYDMKKEELKYGTWMEPDGFCHIAERRPPEKGE